MQVHSSSGILSSLQGIHKLLGNGFPKAHVITAASPQPALPPYERRRDAHCEGNSPSPAWLVALGTRKCLRRDGREQRLWVKSSHLPRNALRIPPAWDFCRGLGSKQQLMQAVRGYVPHDKQGFVDFLEQDSEAVYYGLAVI